VTLLERLIGGTSQSTRAETVEFVNRWGKVNQAALEIVERRFPTIDPVLQEAIAHELGYAVVAAWEDVP